MITMENVKTSDDKNIIITDKDGNPDILIYLNPFTKLWTTISQYGSPVLSPSEELEPFIQKIISYRNDMDEFWGN